MDKSGVARFVGDKRALRQSQTLVINWGSMKFGISIDDPYSDPYLAPQRRLLRAYPSGLGDSIHKIYSDELRRPVHGDLRVIPKLHFGKSDLHLFSTTPMGDVWKDADLLPVWNYIYLCKHTRTPNCVGRMDHLNRIMYIYILTFICHVVSTGFNQIRLS